MNSLTKTRLAPHVIRQLIAEVPAVGDVINIRELNEGYYNASYALDTRTGESFVLKVAPAADIDILTYEHNIMQTEVRFMERVRKRVPCPRILHSDFTRSRIPNDFYVMEILRGEPLTHFEPVPASIRRILYTELAGYLAAMHRILGPHFGYPALGDRFAGRSYREAFLLMLHMTLADGRRRAVDLPLTEAELVTTVRRHADVFDTIRTPVLVHYDLWDGNLFVDGMPAHPAITGIVDFERGFWGDPCADFSQAMGAIDLHEDTWFLDAYNAAAHTPMVFGEDERIRTLLYRIYLFVIMVTESSYRDVQGSFDAQLAWSRDQLMDALSQL